MNTRSQSNQKIATRSATHLFTRFYELQDKTNKRPTTPPPTAPATPSAPLKPLSLQHPDTLASISRNLFESFEREKYDGFLLDPDSSSEWMKNKLKKDRGHYVYKCGRPNPNSGRKCTCATHDSIGLYSGCIKHYMWEENLNKYLNF